MDNHLTAPASIPDSLERDTLGTALRGPGRAVALALLSLGVATGLLSQPVAAQGYSPTAPFVSVGSGTFMSPGGSGFSSQSNYDVPVRYQAPANGGFSSGYYYGYGYGYGYPGYYSGRSTNNYQGYNGQVGAERTTPAARSSRSDTLPTYDTSDWHSERSNWHNR